MKQIVIAVAMVFALTPTAFAGEEKVGRNILEAFNNQFFNARDVSWIAGINYCKVNFTYEGKRLCAYYNSRAELMGLVRNISFTELPVYLQSTLQKKYGNYWITELFELTNEDGKSFFITLKNEDSKITLESRHNGNWNVYR